MEALKIKECEMLDPLSVDKKESVINLAKSMKEHKVRQITVTDKEEPVGVVSAVDVVNKVVAEGADASNLAAEDIMTSPIVSCDADDSAFQIYTGMAEKNIMSCPVVENKKLIGTITMQSLVMALNQRAKHICKDMEQTKQG